MSTFDDGFCHDIGTTYPTSGVLIGIALATDGLDDFSYPSAIPVLLHPMPAP